MPGDVDLEGRVRVLGNDVLISGNVEEAVIILQYRCRARTEYRYL
jgi:hypothetical protein